MKVKDFYEQLNKLSPFESALSWDNVGLLVGDFSDEVKKVCITLDVSEECIDYAKDRGCDMILSHHPFIFSSLKQINDKSLEGRRILKMLRWGIDNIAMHTNFDVYVMGDIVTKRLGVSSYEPFDVTLEVNTKEGDKRLGIGTIATIDSISVEDLSKHVKEAFKLPFVGYYGAGDRKVSKMVVVPGAGKSEVDLAISMGADVMVTGDITHHVGLDAAACGLSLIDAGHYGLEHIFIEYMAGYIREHFSEVAVETMDISFPRGLV